MLYALVILVALSKGPLISLQSILLGFVGLVVLILAISSLARNIKLVDEADENDVRKKHKGAIPLIGGLVLFISIIYGASVFGVDSFYFYVIISLFPIIFIGTLDGLESITLPISIRIIAQILASWFVILSTDIYIRDLGNLFGQGQVDLNGFGIPFTIFAVVGVCNAFNMLDGKDGLTGSVSIVVISCLLALLYLNDIIFNLGLILIASLLVFLVFNLNLLGSKQKIFLGDHGSNGLGHIIAWILVFLSQEPKALITPISAVWFIFLPVTDALMTIYRRLRSSKSILLADNEHFHHILHNLGLSDRKVLLSVIIISVVSGVIATVSNYFSLKEYNLFFGYVTILIILILATNNKKKIT